MRRRELNFQTSLACYRRIAIAMRITVINNLLTKITIQTYFKIEHICAF